MTTAADPSRRSTPRYDRSIGIDLSAGAINTAAVELTWEGDRASIVNVWGEGRQEVDDSCLVDLLDRADAMIGVDCPFGWPVPFVQLMATQTDDVALSLVERRDTRLGTPAERESLVLRATDQWVIDTTRDQLGKAVRPLSVSADRIAHVAFRFAGLRAQLTRNADAPRDGSGRLVEVYPAAALAMWGLQATGYKGGDADRRGIRRTLVEALVSGGVDGVASRIDLGSLRDALVESDHVLDALVCALIARDGDVRGPSVPLTHRSLALAEGWIHLPEPAAHRPSR